MDNSFYSMKINSELFKVLTYKDHDLNYFLLNSLYRYLTIEREKNEVILFLIDKINEYKSFKKEKIYEIDNNEVEKEIEEKTSLKDIAFKKFNLFLNKGWIKVNHKIDFKEEVELNIYTSYLFEAFFNIEKNNNYNKKYNYIDLITPLNNIHYSLKRIMNDNDESINFGILDNINVNLDKFLRDLNESNNIIIAEFDKLAKDENLKTNDIIALIMESSYYSFFTSRILPLEENNRLNRLLYGYGDKINQDKKGILDLIDDIYLDKIIHSKLIENEVRRNNIVLNDEEYNLLNETILSFLDEFKDKIERIIPLIKKIIRKDNEYLNRAVSRIKFLNNHSNNYSSKIKRALKTLKYLADDDLISFSSLFYKSEIINEGSLYSPKKRNYYKEEIKLKEVSNYEINEKEKEIDHRIIDSMKYSPIKIYQYALDILKERNKIPLIDILNNNNDDVIKTLYLFIYDNEEAPYKIEYIGNNDLYDYISLNNLKNFILTKKEVADNGN